MSYFVRAKRTTQFRPIRKQELEKCFPIGRKLIDFFAKQFKFPVKEFLISNVRFCITRVHAKKLIQFPPIRKQESEE